MSQVATPETPSSTYGKNQRRYYERHRAEVCAASRDYYARNVATCSEKMRAYRETHREERRLADRCRYWRKKAAAMGIDVSELDAAVAATTPLPAPDPPATPATPV